MQVSPELIGSAVLALIGVLSGITTLVSKKSREQREELDQLRRDFKALRDQLVLTDTWLFLMKRALAQHGLETPDPPEGLNTVGEQK